VCVCVCVCVCFYVYAHTVQNKELVKNNFKSYNKRVKCKRQMTGGQVEATVCIFLCINAGLTDRLYVLFAF